MDLNQHKYMVKPYKQYISIQDVSRIHENTLQILSDVGVKFENRKALEILKKHGARVNDDTVRFSEKMLMNALNTAPEKFTIRSNSYKDIQIGDGSMLTIGLASNSYIKDGDIIRKTTNQDNIDQFKLGVTSPVIESSVLNQFPDLKNFSYMEKVYGIYAMDLLYSNKSHLNANEMTLGLEPEIVYDLTRHGIKLLKRFEGIENDCICYRSLNVLSPLTYDSAPIEKMFATCDEGQSLILSPCSMPVLTGPYSVAGILSMNNAEILAGLILAQCIRPGTGFIYGNTSGSTDLKNLSLCIGTPETALIMYGTAALADFYHLPFRCGGALSDAKELDYQAGAESMMMLKATMDVRPDVVYHMVGGIGTFNVISFEKYILDEEVIRMVSRLNKGIDTEEEKLCFSDILEVGPRGNFLKGKTPKMFKNEFLKAQYFNKADPNQWQEKGRKNINVNATNIVKRRLEEYIPPERTKDQRKLLEEYIPAEYRERI